jgi:uncharacterized protein YpmS
MGKIKEMLDRFDTLPLWKKALLIILAPSLLIFLLPKLFQTQVDEKAQELGEKLSEVKGEAKEVERQVSELENEKEGAMNDVKNQDAVSFHNHRKPD